MPVLDWNTCSILTLIYSPVLHKTYMLTYILNGEVFFIIKWHKH